MIIDLNAYHGHWPFRRLRHNDADGLLALMDRAGIDRACVSSASAIFYKNSQAGNEELAEDIADHRDRLIPFAVINPTYADWEHDLQVCVEDLGARGLRLYPNYHDYSLGDAACNDLVAAATEHGLLLSIPIRQIDQRQRHWLLEIPDVALGEVEELVGRHPDARFALLNGIGFVGSRLGQADNELPDNYVVGISRLTALMASEVRQLLDNLGPERVAFGSGMPFKYPEPALLKVEVLEATEDEKQGIRAGNAARLLGLDEG
ncbi:MAG: amidohydrolase family protein [Armatimonadota bacterium]|nr:amidohydrolase family protein [Armatimonadota bacterium]